MGGRIRLRQISIQITEIVKNGKNYETKGEFHFRINKIILFEIWGNFHLNSINKGKISGHFGPIFLELRGQKFGFRASRKIWR